MAGMVGSMCLYSTVGNYANNKAMKQIKIVCAFLLVVLMGGCGRLSNGNTVGAIHQTSGMCVYDMGPYEPDICDTCGKFQIGDTVYVVNHPCKPKTDILIGHDKPKEP